MDMEGKDAGEWYNANKREGSLTTNTSSRYVWRGNNRLFIGKRAAEKTGGRGWSGFRE